MKNINKFIFASILISTSIFGEESKSFPIWEKFSTLRCKGIQYFECHDEVCVKNQSKINWLIKFNENKILFDLTFKTSSNSSIQKQPSERKILSRVFKKYGSSEVNIIFLDDGQIVNFYSPTGDRYLSSLTSVADSYVDKGILKTGVTTSTHQMICEPTN